MSDDANEEKWRQAFRHASAAGQATPGMVEALQRYAEQLDIPVAALARLMDEELAALRKRAPSSSAASDGIPAGDAVGSRTVVMAPPPSLKDDSTKGTVALPAPDAMPSAAPSTVPSVPVPSLVCAPHVRTGVAGGASNLQPRASASADTEQFAPVDASSLPPKHQPETEASRRALRAFALFVLVLGATWAGWFAASTLNASYPDIPEPTTSAPPLPPPSPQMPTAATAEEQRLATLRRLAELGNVDAMAELGHHYAGFEKTADTGRDTYAPRDIQRAILYMEKAAKAGHAPSQLELANQYLQGTGIPANSEAAERWLRQAAEASFAPAQFRLAQVCFEESGTRPARPGEAMEWLRRAAYGGMASAQYELGHRLTDGHGVRRDPREGREWLERAAKQGHPQAKEILESFDEDPKGATAAAAPD